METLPETWVKIRPQDIPKFESELAHEVCAKHPLSGVTAHCIARRENRDDFLFHFPKYIKPFGVVRLTWSKKKSPDFPWVTFFESENDFCQNWRQIFD